MSASDPLRVLTTVPRSAFPVIDALKRLHRDVGSMKARHALPLVDPPPDDDERVICVGCVDVRDVDKLAHDLARELHGDADSAALAANVAILTLSHGLCVVAFLDLPCMRAEEEEP
jgi:hypothetical protein